MANADHRAHRMLDLQDTPTDPRRRHRRSEWWIVGGVLAALAGLLLIAARDVFDAPQDAPEPQAKPQAANAPQAPVETPVVESVIDDDGKTLWASPTHGPPLELAYLPPGVEIILAVRPAELNSHPEGAKVVAALGPAGTNAIASLEEKYGVKLGDIERLIVGWRVQAVGTLVATTVVATTDPLKPSGDYFQPRSAEGRVTVFAPPAILAEIRRLNGQPPPLARGLEQVIGHTDQTRTATLIVQPRALLSDTSNALNGTAALLRRPLEAILGDHLSAAALSLDWGENFFIELVAVPTLDSSPARMSDELADRIGELNSQVEEFVLDLQVSPYGRRVVARLPEMVRRLAAYTRHGVDRDAAILRCYLPVQAGHNLIMGAELALAEAHGVVGLETGERPLAEASSPGSVVEELQAKTSLRFDREELEAALDILSQDLGVPIEIRGPDLQADGITRNQLFAIDMHDRTGEEILVEILRRANPDKLAAGPADPRQKLVYIVGPEAIVITTRSRAAERGEALPEVFREAR